MKDSAAGGRPDSKSTVMTETKSEEHMPMRMGSIESNVGCVSKTLREEAVAELKRWKLREMESFMVGDI